MKKKYLRFLLFPVYTLAFFLVIDYLFFYRPFVKKLPLPTGYLKATAFEQIPQLDETTIRRIGYSLHEKLSSYTNFAVLKPPGTIRIGCFGESITYGDEVDTSNDYPTLLQKIFIEQGYANVQVLNFASSGYSFQQCFIVWQDVAKKFDLDYILLGPMGFHWIRDTTFASEFFYVSHSRYIIDHGRLRLIDPIGENPWERILRSRRFFPSYRYLRYEKNTPLLLAALLPAGRDFKVNPCYYWHGDLQQEALELYRLQFSEMAASGKQIVLFHFSPELVRLGQNLERPNFTAIEYAQSPPGMQFFPYKAPREHHGPCGNHLIAHFMFDILAGRRDSSVAVLHHKPEVLLGDVPLPLLDYDEIGFSINNVVLGRFSKMIELAARKPLNQLREPIIPSLIAFKDSQSTIFESLWIPANQTCTKDGVVTLEAVTQSGGKLSLPLACTIINPASRLMIVEYESRWFSNRDIEFKFESHADIRTFGGRINSTVPLTSVKLTLDKQTLLESKALPRPSQLGIVPPKAPAHDENGGLESPPSGPSGPFPKPGYAYQYGLDFSVVSSWSRCFYFIASDPAGFLDVAQCGDSGTTDLYLKTRTGEEIRMPFSRWEKRPFNLPFGNVYLERPVGKPGQPQPGQAGTNKDQNKNNESGMMNAE